MAGPALRLTGMLLIIASVLPSAAADRPRRSSRAVRKAPAPVAVPYRRLLPNRSPLANEIVFAAVGDLMLGSTYPPSPRPLLPPHDGRDLLQEVARVLSGADITFGNLEGALAEGGRPRAKCRKSSPACHFFRMPTRYAARLKDAGFNVLGNANNHAYDFGDAGHLSTRRALDAVGLAHSGRIGDIARLQIKGRKVDLIAFSTSPGTYSMLQLDEAAQVVRAAAQEADIVIVSFHGGGEGALYQKIPHGNEFFLGEDRGDVVAFAHAMIDAGAHIVVGHGPHVVRAMEFYRDRLIAYSLGNFATYMGIDVQGPGGITLILEVHLALDGSFRSARVYPAVQERGRGPRLDSAKTVLPVLRQLSATQFGDRGAIFTDTGSAFNGPPCLPRIYCFR